MGDNSSKKPSSPSKLNKSNSENEKASKKKKDPNAPKQPLSSYMLFAQEERLKIKADNPTMPSKDVAVEMGKRWKKLTDEERNHYVKVRMIFNCIFLNTQSS